MERRESRVAQVGRIFAKPSCRRFSLYGIVSCLAISRNHSVDNFDIGIAHIKSLCYHPPMKEKPVPHIIRLYKSQVKILARVSKKSKVSRAAVVRNAIDNLLIENKESIPTMTEIVMPFQEDKYYANVKKHLAVVLDFVERWNKNDEERDVAQSAQFLSTLLSKPPSV